MSLVFERKDCACTILQNGYDSAADTTRTWTARQIPAGSAASSSVSATTYPHPVADGHRVDGGHAVALHIRNILEEGNHLRTSHRAGRKPIGEDSAGMIEKRFGNHYRSRAELHSKKGSMNGDTVHSADGPDEG